MKHANSIAAAAFALLVLVAAQQSLGSQSTRLHPAKVLTVTDHHPSPAVDYDFYGNSIIQWQRWEPLPNGAYKPYYYELVLQAPHLGETE